MNQLILNDDNLKDDEIENVIARVKAFMINSKKEILVITANGGIQLVGGHVDEGEEPLETLIREIKEEAGIDIMPEEISSPFFEVRHYIKNYFRTNKKTIAKITYYIVKTDKPINLNKRHLTDREKEHDFDLNYIPYNFFEEYIRGFLNSESEANQWIANEVLVAFDEMKRIIK